MGRDVFCCAVWNIVTDMGAKLCSFEKPALSARYERATDELMQAVVG